MADPWNKTWRRADKRRFRGGQSDAFVAEKSDGSGQLAFVKLLKNQRNAAARKRLYREAITYETLENANIPRLLEHNASAWERPEINLYLALEYIEGSSLAEYLRDNGPMSLDAAIHMTRVLADALGAVHEQGVLHRDIKPANIMLPGSRTEAAMLVDFGLSFNESDELDITRVNEEVGNRFLRLPEHTLSFRSPASDVSQLAGVLFAATTGIEPRVLLDSDGLQPHQRSSSAEALGTVVGMTDAARMRLMSVFDRAFAVQIDARYQAASELITDLEVIARGTIPGEGLESLRERMRLAAASPARREASAQRQSLQNLLLRAGHVFKHLASTNGLLQSQGGQRIYVEGGVPQGRTRLALFDASVERSDGREYLFEMAGTSEATLRIDGDLTWRGDPKGDEELDARIEESALAQCFAEFGQ